MKPPKVTSRQIAQQKTRETLLVAAAKLVAEKGLGAVSIGDITQTTGFTKGAFYSNFDSREAMLLELFKQIQRQQRAAMDELDRETVPSLEEARTLLVEIAMRHINSPSASLLIAEVQLQSRRDPRFADEARASFEDQQERFAGWLDAVMKASRLRCALPPRELARVFMALTQGLSLYTTDRSNMRGLLRDVLQVLFAPAK